MLDDKNYCYLIKTEVKIVKLNTFSTLKLIFRSEYFWKAHK